MSQFSDKTQWDGIYFIRSLGMISNCECQSGLGWTCMYVAIMNEHKMGHHTRLNIQSALTFTARNISNYRHHYIFTIAWVWWQGTHLDLRHQLSSPHGCRQPRTCTGSYSLVPLPRNGTPPASVGSEISGLWC